MGRDYEQTMVDFNDCKRIPQPPSLTEVAAHAGCSRQNVKKIAAILEKKGYVELVTETDMRAVRIVLTKKFHEFYQPFVEKSALGINALFGGMTNEEIETFFYLLGKLGDNVDYFTNECKTEKKK